MVRVNFPKVDEIFPLQCADAKVEALSDVLQATVTKWKTRIPAPLPLELYTSSTFIGLFVEEHVAEVLKSFAAEFASEAAAKAGSAIKKVHLKKKNPSCNLQCVFVIPAFVSVSPQMFTLSPIKSSSMSLWRTTSKLATSKFWRS